MKNVYVVFAVETNGPVDGEGKPLGAMEAYAVGATEDIAQAIIDKDVDDGQIHDNAYIQKMVITEYMNEV